ncbi:hypothetical protein [Microbacterium sp. ZXX196]|uniref:hypothetical protein n=1 Tax=Microbacterium sp. ZXX196 TaxID=2609291 RepID=UPI0012B756F6|nr:hypothetical protein [Microbacterium sp. ZXX196]MTE24855.1 hypothetical protein [Microbacterium sp. ZXX196]
MTHDEWVEKVKAEAITPEWGREFPVTPARRGAMSHAEQVADADAFIEEMERRRALRERAEARRQRERLNAEYRSRVRQTPGPHSWKGVA